MREAGLPVELRSRASRATLAPGVDLSAYRIVQEALTNALKHAGPASARVTVRYTDTELDIEIADDGAGTSNGDVPAGGHGLVGMRERVALFGGEMAAGRAAQRRLRGPRAAADREGRVSIRVLLADDQALVRGGLRKIIDHEDDMAVVAEAADGIEAVDAARASQPDVAVVDIRMPRLDGIEATRRIVAALGDEVRVLILTTFGLDDYVFDALRAGASAFMLKDAPPEELVEAIRVVAGGSALLAPAVTRSVISEFARASPAPARAAAGPRGADRPRARGPRPAHARPVERRDRCRPRRQRGDGQDPRRARAHEARRARPRAGGDLRLRVRAGRPRRRALTPRSGGGLVVQCAAS